MKYFKIKGIQLLLLLFAINIAFTQTIPDSLITAKEFSPRGGLPSFFAKVKAGKTVKIAFLGGSITRAGNGYRDQILTWFRAQYPSARFEEIMAAVSGTASDFGACRVQEQAIKYKPDLVFVEFAVNENKMRMQLVRETVEGIVRQIWKGNKSTDICFIYTFAAENLPLLQQRIFPTSVSAMETIADYYSIPSIHMGLAIVDEITNGKLLISGKKDEQSATPLFSLDGVHPLSETGHKMYTTVLSKNLLLLENNAVAVKHKLIAARENKNWADAGMVNFNKRSTQFTGDWNLTDSVTRGKEYYQLQPQVYASASEAAVLKVKFKGTRFGLADIMGPGTAAIEVAIDDQAPRVINRFDAFSTYYRLNYLIISDLPKGKHIATIRLSDKKIDKEAILKARNVVVKDWSLYDPKVIYVGAVLY